MPFTLSDNAGRQAEPLYRFGPFTLLPARRQLLEEGREVRLGGKAMDLLILLVERAGAFVSYQEIFSTVWPRTVVVEGNLRVHIAGIRKALGEGIEGRRFILNAPSQGYSFVAPLLEALDAPARTKPMQVAGAGNLPPVVSRLIGQESAIEAVVNRLLEFRLVTLVGPGGIGKTSVALVIAADARIQTQAYEGTYFVDLASVSEASLVPSAVAAALGLASVAANPIPELCAYVKGRQLLLVLDNCEHVIDAVAPMVEQLLREAHEVRVLATSREPLRAIDEWVHRVQALAFPPQGSVVEADQVISYPGVALFVERMSAARDGYKFVAADAEQIAKICRKVDGIPLAIELAAARAASIGLPAVADALEESLMVLARGRRTAIARHRTLRATLDWSYRLLPALEQKVLRRLSIFAGAFSLSSIGPIADAGDLTAEAALGAVIELVEKSLISSDVSSEEPFFRLLETTRSYALDALKQDDEYGKAQVRHASHCLDLLVQAELDWSASPMPRWLSVYGRRIDDVRSALSWCFSPEGDKTLGVSLTAKSGLLFFQLSLADEYRALAERALRYVHTHAGVEPKWEFELNVVYGHMLYHTVGLPPERQNALDRARTLAELIGEPRLKALAVSTAWMASYQTADAAEMLKQAELYEGLTSGETDPAWTHMYDRMKAPALHFAGDQQGAVECCERGLAIEGVVRPPFISGSQITLRVSMGAVLARALWLQGEGLAAETRVQDAIRAAISDGESVALAFLLGITACPLAIWSGNWQLARERTQLLLDHTRRHALRSWQNYGLAFRAVLDWVEGGMRAGGPKLKLSSPPTPPLIELLATLNPAFAGAAVRDRVAQGHARWCAPEVARVFATSHVDAPATVENELKAAIRLARASGAVAWELRAANSLSELLLRLGRQVEIPDVLGQLLSYVNSRHSGADLVRAQELMSAAAA